MKLSDLLRLSRTRKYTLNGIPIKISDYILSHASNGIFKDLEKDCYNIKGIGFEKDDIVIDIGANTGFFCIYLAKKYPFINIYAFEPVPDNFNNLKKNIEINNVSNIKIFNKAVSSDGRDLKMNININNSGGGSSQTKSMDQPGTFSNIVRSITIDNIFKDNHIKKCKLLKIDCEGSEHEILLNSKILDKIEYLSAEFHINEHLAKQGYSIERLLSHCQQFIKPEKIHYTACKMCE